MASSSELSSGPDRRVVPALAASGTGALPLDALYEILLRLSAKELCRLRTVSRPWRTLLSDPQFAAAHAARHPEPLIIASYGINADHDTILDIMDLSGHSVRKVQRKKEYYWYWVKTMALDLIHVISLRNLHEILLNPATGAVYHLSDQPGREALDVFVFGQSASTGEYKALRMVQHISDGHIHQVSVVCTPNKSSNTIWRGKQPPPQILTRYDRTAVVIDGVAYFLSSKAYHDLAYNRVSEEDLIVTFDLETEAWATARGPHFSFPDNAFQNQVFKEGEFTLANLSGSLAVAHGHGPDPELDIWIQMDFVNSLWVRQYSIKFEQYDRLQLVHPLLVLDDRRVVLYTEEKGEKRLQIYNPTRNTFTNVVELKHCTGISMYTGNLLSLKC